MEIAVAALGALALGVAVGFGLRKMMASRDVASAETRARHLVTEAEREAKETVRRALQEVKDEVAAMRRQAEADIRLRREESQRRESRLAKRDEDLDAKSAELERAGRRLADRTATLDRLKEDLSRAKDEHRRQLEHVARMTAQEAKEALIGQMTEQAKRDAMGTVREIEQGAREEADERARKIVTIAIQRVASEQTAESTVSVFTLPSDDLSPDDSGPTVHWVIVTQIHNALLEINENYVIERVLAESYQAAPDGSSYTFKLRRGVKFHDGREFTADDVKYTYEWYINPANNAVNALAFDGVDKIDTPDKYTVVVKMKSPNATFLRRGATMFIVPAHYHGRVGEKTYKTAPIGTGAFRLKEWRPAEFTTVEAFDQHFRGRPNIDIFREDIVPDASVRAVAMRTGTSDSPVWPLLAEDNLALEADARYTAYRTVSLAVNHFPINTEHPLLSDKRVRQALTVKRRMPSAER